MPRKAPPGNVERLRSGRKNRPELPVSVPGPGALDERSPSTRPETQGGV